VKEVLHLGVDVDGREKKGRRKRCTREFKVVTRVPTAITVEGAPQAWLLRQWHL
jgi:hypothetical protein